MGILAAVSFLLLGSGAASFLINLGMNIINSFNLIMSSTLSGSPDISMVVQFIKNLVLGLGLLLVYYIVSAIISKILVRD